MSRYATRFYEEDGWWMAEVPVFAALTQGRTLAEARLMARDLVSIHLEDLRERGAEPAQVPDLPPGLGWEWVSPYAPGEERPHIDFGEEEDDRP